MLSDVLAELGLPAENIILLGHSMDGVIACPMAAAGPSWPLKGVIATGFAKDLPKALADGFMQLPQQYYIELLVAMKDQLMFGPPETLAPDMPAQSHIANTHMPRAEAIDIIKWAERAADILAAVRVPVYYKLAQYEQLWDISQQEKVAALFQNSPHVVTGIIAEVGHCLDFHLLGSQFQDEILAFASSL